MTQFPWLLENGCVCALRDGTEDWGAWTTLTTLILPKSPGQDSLRLRLWFPGPSVPCLGGAGRGPQGWHCVSTTTCLQVILCPLLHTDILSPLSAISLKAVRHRRGPFANEERRKQPGLHLSHEKLIPPSYLKVSVNEAKLLSDKRKMILAFQGY